MKNQYIIVKHIDTKHDLFYNHDVNGFVCMRKSATIFTNKRRTIDLMKYATKYAFGSDYPGTVEIIQL